MKNYIQPGNVVTLAAPAAVSSGDGVLVGMLFGVATADAESGDDFEAVLRGVFDLPKAAGGISQGDIVYWDDSAKNVTTVDATTAGDNHVIGWAIVTAASGDATARILVG